MEWSVLVIAAVCAVTAIMVAYMVDARSANERKKILSSPPDRTGLEAEEAPAYVTEKDVRARSAHRSGPALTEDVATRLSEAACFGSGWASEDFVTDPKSRRAVLDSPIVLVAESVVQVADLVPAIQQARVENTGLAVAAGEVAPDVVATLAMNSLSGRLACVCVVAEDLDRIAAEVGASVVPGADLRAGYLPREALGRCEAWVSDSSHTWVLRTDQPQPSSSK